MERCPTNIFFWDLTEELLKSSAARHWAREGARQDRAREGKVGAQYIVGFLPTILTMIKGDFFCLDPPPNLTT